MRAAHQVTKNMHQSCVLTFLFVALRPQQSAAGAANLQSKMCLWGVFEATSLNLPVLPWLAILPVNVGALDRTLFTCWIRWSFNRVKTDTHTQQNRPVFTRSPM
jgi:hypothetical protein